MVPRTSRPGTCVSTALSTLNLVSNGPGKITKPTVFISHATTDRPIAEIIKNEIDQVFAKGVKVFASSIPGTITPGSDWLGSVRKSLEAASAVAVLITPVSINRPWIWFEVGASWSQMEGDQRRIYPLCVPEIDVGDLPEPLSRLQALSLGKANDIKEFFGALTDQFGFGNMKGFRGSTIKSKLPGYPTLKVAESDIRRGALVRALNMTSSWLTAICRALAPYSPRWPEKRGPET
jgi:hypothetical protein